MKEEEEEKGGEEREGMGEKQHPTSSFLSWFLEASRNAGRTPGFPRQTLRRGRPTQPGASCRPSDLGEVVRDLLRSPLQTGFWVNLSPKDTGSESIVLVTHNMEFLLTVIDTH